MQVSTKVGGALAWFPVREGDWVEAGQELARLETVDADLELARVQAERQLAAAELRLRSAGFRPEEVAEVRAQVRGAEVELGAAEGDLTRFEGLLQTGSGTEKARDDARTRRDVARRALEGLRQRLRKLEAGFRQEEIDAAQARLAVAEARIAQIEQRIRDARVSAPGAGVVIEKLVEQGELLAPATPLAVVANLREPWLVAYVGELDLGSLRLNQPARVVTDGGRERTGRLVYISPEAEFTPRNVQTRDERVKLVFEIKVALDNEDNLFKPGMPAEVFLQRQTEHGAPGVLTVKPSDP